MRGRTAITAIVGRGKGGMGLRRAHGGLLRTCHRVPVDEMGLRVSRADATS